jgi:hypothetical protein
MDSKTDQEGDFKQEKTMETKQQKETRNTEETQLYELTQRLKDIGFEYLELIQKLMKEKEKNTNE